MVLVVVVLVVVAGSVVATVVGVEDVATVAVAVDGLGTPPVTAPVSVVAVHAEIVTAASAANVTTLRGPEPAVGDRVEADDINTPPVRRDRD